MRTKDFYQVYPSWKKLICEKCGREFWVSPGHFQKFCSINCRKTGKFIKCETCGKEFWAKLAYLKNNMRFCSSKCYGKWRKGKFNGENGPGWKGGMVEKVCEKCGKKFKVHPYRGDEARFCSAKCTGDWLTDSGHCRGENNGRWKGGVTPFEYKLRGSRKYLRWRAEVVKRDKKCQRCGEKDRRILAVHHIKSLADLINEFWETNKGDELYNLAIKYKPFWNIDNGITYCQVCHGIIHHDNPETNA
jgi:hypothetical protein